MIRSDQLIGEGLQGGDLLFLYNETPCYHVYNNNRSLHSRTVTDLHVNGLVEVLMLLDERLNAVQRVALVVAGKERLASCHPVLGLFTVPVE